jgi:hypothetical protein
VARLPVIGPKPIPGDKRRRLELDALYAELPRLDCRGLCAESCGPIVTTRVEWQRICRAAGYEPKALVGVDGLTCPLLKDNRCTVYEVRPLICRLWGLVETMPCLWGCKPERYLTHEEGLEFLTRAAEINA